MQKHFSGRQGIEGNERLESKGDRSDAFNDMEGSSNTKTTFPVAKQWSREDPNAIN